MANWRYCGNNIDSCKQQVQIMAMKTPENIKSYSFDYDICSDSPTGGSGIYSWNWSEVPKGEHTPCTYKSSDCKLAKVVKENKRGRPRSDVISHLIVEGSTSLSAIKCKYCNRVFPRDKSLQAHLRIHTGERPYTCDYPGCKKAFTQSGQLNTHQRLHTGEKPFACSHEGCSMRFTHANRHCPDHPTALLRRNSDFVLRPITSNPEQSEEVLRWLERYRAEKEDKTPKVSGKNSRKMGVENDDEYHYVTKKVKARKILLHDINRQENYTSPQSQHSPCTSSDAFSEEMFWSSPDSEKCRNSDIHKEEQPPKKRWIREAWKDQALWGYEQELAQPIQWTEKECRDDNATRPTVLMLAKKKEDSDLSFVEHDEYNMKWLGAMALMELAKPKAEAQDSVPVNLSNSHL